MKRKGASDPTSGTTEDKRKKLETKENTESHSVLARSFDRDVRPLINLIDGLRRLGLDRDIGLPAVVVVGDQSAGKSSVLEAISGVQLPRGTGIVTRCPLEMQMKRQEMGWEAEISYKDKHEKECKEKITDASNVGKHVEQAQQKMTDSEKGISDELITLEIRSPDVPDLTLIDLPGIARNAVEGQPHDIEKQIKRLIENYIKHRETIILAVVPCNVDIATCEAIKMAREVDKKGCRTIGVLTKPDLIDKGAEETTLRVLHSNDFKLKANLIVKCRSQQDINEGKSLKDAIDSETAFFEQHSHFGDIPSNQRGIPTLSTRLSQELIMHIRNQLPELKKTVRQKLQDTDAKLKELGPDPPQDIPKKRNEALKRLNNYSCLKIRKDYLKIKMVNNFMGILVRVMKGGSSQEDKKQVQELSKEARICYEKLLEEAEQIGSDFTEPGEKMKKGLQNEMIRLRGREFANYIGKYELVESTARNYVKKMTMPAIRCFDHVHFITTEVLNILAEACFQKYPDFMKKTKDIIYKIGRQTSEAGRAEITRYLEMEDQVYSQDKTYLSSLSEKVKGTENRQPASTEEQTTQAKDRQDFRSTDEVPSPLPTPPEKVNEAENRQPASTEEQTTQAKDRQYFRSTNEVPSSRGQITCSPESEVVAQEDKADDDDEEEEEEEDVFSGTAVKCGESVDKAIASLAAYYKVATRRLCDVIPMMIKFHLFKEQMDSLGEGLRSLATDDKILDIFNEDPETADKRRRYQERQTRLDMAEKELDDI